ncbi:hypothetical protein NPX13_g2489 [Xylaria arbuscula]|uniref:C3H1-type domain-containing protein n=1 Tax=Xylaria arbuscula TaxID=114810 RepID=A0A9W8TQB0_9PEZI|nr:hypothetical protein NPX13_g2489 [Xylaria arbuscula]
MSNPRVTKQQCRLFMRNRCTFGARCKFSHATTNPATTQPQDSPTHSQLPGSNQRRDDDLHQWKRLLRQERNSPNRNTCERFFELAVQLIDGDLGACQETVKLLSGEEGLGYIRLLVEKYIPGSPEGAGKLATWTRLLQPLFTIITHQRVIDSAVLEQHVATIYNFVQGIGSKRMKIIFGFLIDLVGSVGVAGSSAIADATATKLAMVEAGLNVLCKMIDCNTNNIIDDHFKIVTERLDDILKNMRATPDQYSVIQSKKWICYIHSRLGAGNNLPSSVLSAAQSFEPRATFILPKDLPGRLCLSGPRHDNDHENITHIRVLPTKDEVVSTRGEYLPSNNPSSFHLPGVIGRLDREFRLLREDTVGQLRDAVRGALDTMQHQGRNSKKQDERRSILTNLYEGAEVVDASFDQLSGLDLLVQFPQRKGATYQKRQDWWTQSKRLQPGAFVCMISGDGSILFCVVAETTTIASNQKGDRRRGNHVTEETSEQSKPSLAGDDVSAYMHLNIAEAKDHNLAQGLRWYRNIGPKHPKCLVEFPGVLLASFQHTLEALQRMTKTPDVPFTDLIAPETQDGGIADIAPPQYATKDGFYFDLGCLATDGTELKLSINKYFNPQTLLQHSTLDETQSSALVNGLSRGLALIQGPPGTGKSYTGEKIIKVLLENKKRGKLGPILCVCYTNHALDQLLEHLLDDGVKQIIRIGSRSKSKRLEEVNLRAVARSAERTKPEKASLWETRNALEANDKNVTRSLLELHHCMERRALEAHLAEYHPPHHEALFGTSIDEDGFQEVQRNPHKRFDNWLHGGNQSKGTSRRDEQLLRADLWTMANADRQRLHRYWQKQARDQIIQDVVSEHQTYMNTKEQRNHVIQEVDLRCLSSADVIGVTTTGLARNLDLLRRLRCKVLLCEEAGEVLEAHNLTALLPSIEHCILIGDQLQLRPQIQNYDLSSANPRGVQYSLDVSLFERLVNPPREGDQKLPCDTLQTQRRMHPSISNLVRQTLYPLLVDDRAVAEYPEVVGMKKRMFWLHHTIPEDRAQQQDPTSTSHTNSFEVDMTVALVQHLVRQGTYAPDDIAVITPYLGQLHRLRRALQSLFQISFGERDLEDLAALDASNVGESEEAGAALRTTTQTTLLQSVRLATVDNFQGEEAKVVVISLVRSNNERRYGFLSTSNRINVLVSRAKHGMYLIGNKDTYEPISMWAQIITMLRNEHNIGPKLQLQCPRHPDQVIEASVPDHFLQFSPEGGCHRQCDRKLACPSLCGELCPNTKYCQECCADDIKSTIVDFIMGSQYHEVNLDEDPCIFPDCGHILTMTNMDGLMDLKAHYKMSPDLDSCPVALSSSSAPFSMDEVKTCPSCRGSLRNIARYGRIVRRAMLDEATKKFVIWSISGLLKLADQLLDVQTRLAAAKVPSAQQVQNVKSSALVISKGRLRHLSQVRKEEQPLQRVAHYVQHAVKQRQTTGTYTFDESNIQVKGVLQGTALLLKCEVLVFTDFMTIRLPFIPLRPELKLDLSDQMRECESLIDMARSAHYPREEVEGHIYFAKFCAFARTLTPEPSEDSAPTSTSSEVREKLKSQAAAHIATARGLLADFPSTLALQPDVEAAEKMLRDAVFYTDVSAEEMRTVYRAMANEFLGTGHWYNCVNGHPFTIGECGMPMEMARCPECNSPVGGASHRAVEGVQRANDIEALAREMDRMGV